MSASNLPRVFKLGHLRLPDPDASLPPAKVVELYAASYPQCHAATLGEPFEEAGELVYEIRRATAHVKGIDYHNSSGGHLIYTGQPNVTPLLEALLGGFALDLYVVGKDTCVTVCSECNDSPSWGSIISSVAQWCAERGDTNLASFDVDEVEEVDEAIKVFGRVAAHLGREPESILSVAEPMIDDLWDTPSVLDVIELAKLLDDGHGLVGVSLSTAYTASRPVHDGFGGAAHYVGRHLYAELFTSSFLHCSASIDEALCKGDLSEAARLLAEPLMATLGGVADEHLTITRAALREHLQQVLADAA